MANVIIIGVLLMLVGLCVRNLVREHRRGELCECSGDCANCKIQCRSNEKYYGVLRDVNGAQTNGDNREDAER